MLTKDWAKRHLVEPHYCDEESGDEAILRTSYHFEEPARISVAYSRVLSASWGRIAMRISKDLGNSCCEIRNASLHRRLIKFLFTAFPTRFGIEIPSLE